MPLADDDSVWDQHSGGAGHRGAEWEDDDGALAEAFYSALPENTRFIFDLLMDHPGELLTADWIATQTSGRRTAGARPMGRRSVASSLTATAQPRADSGRRLPFYWWRDNHGPSRYAMKPSVARLFRNARRGVSGNLADSSSGGWSPAEVTATVDDYLAMLAAEITGQPYSKTEHRRALLPKLNPIRTAAAVEYKHQNISAAMLALGLPHIRGYKPMRNRQASLATEIQRRLEADPKLLGILQGVTAAGKPSGKGLQRTAAPEPTTPAAGAASTGHRTGRFPDYGLLQEENRRRGRQGESLVVEYERGWLRQHNRPDLADSVRWTARDGGDGLGYDVRSFDLNGQERYIEVKSTALGAETPFYITSAELDFAQHHADRYALYRVYDVLGTPRFYALDGDITPVLDLTPMTYSARIAAPAPASNPRSET